MRFFLLFLSLALIACTEEKIQRPGKDIRLKNDRLLYQGREFSGIVVEKFEAVGTVRETRYRSGQPDGKQEEFFEATGRLVARREYAHGRNVGVHEGWFLDGKRRFHYEYDDQGRSNGEFWEWYDSGHPSLFAKFEDGRLLGKKMWREDGKIYMNNVFTDTRAYGVPGTKLCLQVRGP